MHHIDSDRVLMSYIEVSNFSFSCLHQINQQMSGINLNGSGAPVAFGPAGAPMGGWVAPPSGQTLSTQLWK